MSAKESDVLVEDHDDKVQTTMDYDHGGVPFYVAIVWVIFLLSYMVYMAVYALPDWTAWGQL
jgi:hypothetical protein